MTRRIGLSGRTMVVVIAIAALLAAGGWYLFQTDSTELLNVIPLDEPTPDPRLTFDTPFRNVRPNVAYVGDAACANCHSDIDKTYHQHPMGRSAAMTFHAPTIESYDAVSKNPFTALGRLECRIEKKEGRILHHIVAKDKNGRKHAEQTIEAVLAIGSGTRGRSYLYVQEGHVWQSPISWFSEKKIWDLSPGFHNEERFQRPISDECLFCHTHQVLSVPNTLNRYREPIFQLQAAIGCERCHGPGELHVAERSNTAAVQGIDTSIVNPKHLSSALRDSICQQCHLQGEARVPRRGRDIFEYRPGLPLDLFVTAFIKHPRLIDYTKSVGQFEQMTASKCFTSSNGKMGCTSCHDPHGVPPRKKKADWYRGKCVTCHQDQGSREAGKLAECRLPIANRKIEANSCIACHMTTNPSANIAHTSVTDHRILRFPPKNGALAVSPLDPSEPPLVAFANPAAAKNQAEAERSLGMALAKWALDFPAAQRRDQQVVLTMAKARLETSLKKWPNDVPVLETLAQVLAHQGRSDQALQSIKKVVTLVADRERTLSLAVKIALRVGDAAFAEECANKIVEMNPTSFRHRMTRGLLRLELQKLAEAEEDFRAAIIQNPTHCQLRVILAACLQRQNHPEAARRELDVALGMASENIEEWSLQKLFNELARPP